MLPKDYPQGWVTVTHLRLFCFSVTLKFTLLSFVHDSNFWLSDLTINYNKYVLIRTEHNGNVMPLI